MACGETVQLTGVGTCRGGHIQGVLRGDGLHDLTAVKKKNTSICNDVTKVKQCISHDLKTVIKKSSEVMISQK